MATDEHWERVTGAASQGLPYCSCLLELRARVEALEAEANGIAWAFEQSAAKLQQDSSDEGTSYYALAEQSANSKPTPNFAQIRSSADTGLLPMIVSETGSDDEPETERIICSAISGGADYVNGMPRELSLERIRDGDSIWARYVQAPLEVAMPTPAPAAPTGGLVEMLADVWSEGKPLHPAARRAAIRKVASWLRSKSGGHLGSGQHWSQRMEEEANR